MKLPIPSYCHFLDIRKLTNVGNSITENKHLLLKAGNCILRNSIIIQLHVCNKSLLLKSKYLNKYSSDVQMAFILLHFGLDVRNTNQ